MAKDLPYFKFFVSEWNDGDISLEDFETQGLFINLCAYYWSNECQMTLTKAKKKFRNINENSFKYLIDAEIIKIDDDIITINFLDEQKEERIESSKRKSKGGIASAEARKLKKLAEKQQLLKTSSTENQQVLNSCSTEVQVLRREEKREEKKKEEKNKSVFNFRKSLIDNGANEILVTEWLKVRKAKKATNSQIALNDFIAQVNKSHLDIDKALEQCVINSWKGFKSEWVKEIKPVRLSHMPDEPVIM